MSRQEQTMANATSQLHGPPEQSGKELCLLSLDGGGVRGLSTLIILQQLMHRIDNDNPPKPCQYFDMIGGTSTGGLIALMLGRLRMSVRECIEEYEKLIPKIFTPKRPFITMTGKIDGQFDEKALEKGIKDLLVSRGFDEDEFLWEQSTSPDDRICKTFVCVMREGNSKPAVFSSYYNKRHAVNKLKVVKIWEAARATAAASSFFRRIVIDKETFLDGATGANNPTRIVWAEASDVFNIPPSQFEQNVACLVSIGTGVPDTSQFGRSLRRIAIALKDLATDTEIEADNFQREHKDLFMDRKAFRLNVPQTLNKVGLEDSNKLGLIKSATENYVSSQDASDKVELCAQKLREKTFWPVIEHSVKESISSDLAALNQSEFHASLASLQWFTNTKSYKEWKRVNHGLLWYQSDPTGSNSVHRSLAAAIAYHSSSPGINSARPSFGASSRRQKALYFQCDRPQLKRWVQGECPGQARDCITIVSTEVILWSFIIQALLIGCSDFVSLRERITRLHPDDARDVSRGLHKQGGVAIPDLITLFERVLRQCELPEVIAIDNVHLIQSSTCCSLFKVLVDLSESPQLQKKLLIVVSGSAGGICEEHLGQASWRVNDDSERMDCIQGLKFDHWETRQTQVASAATGTNTWVLDDRDYKAWLETPSAVLWIAGKPGSGKSVLAKFLLKSMTSMMRSSADSLFFYGTTSQRSDPSSGVHSSTSQGMVVSWFYSTRLGVEGRAHYSLMRSILYQLLIQNKSLFKIVAPLYRQKSCTNWERNDFKHIFRKISESGVSIICIVDAVDEAEDVSEESILTGRVTRRMSAIKDILDVFGHKFKFIILSRPEWFIEEDYEQLEDDSSNCFKILLENRNHSDVNVIIEKGLVSLQGLLQANRVDSKECVVELYQKRRYQGWFSTKSDMSKRQAELMNTIRKHLETHAQGSVLWVSLVLNELIHLAKDRRTTIIKLEYHLKSLPVQLIQLYQHIFSRLSGDNLSGARKVFWLIIGSTAIERPITIREMLDALAVPEDITQALESKSDPILDRRIQANDWHDLKLQLRRSCGPLIEVVKRDVHALGEPFCEEDDNDDVGPDDIVQFMHRTVKDFFEENLEPKIERFSATTALERVRELAINYLKVCFPSQLTSYTYQAFEDWDGNNVDHRICCLAMYLERRSLLAFALQTLECKALGGPLLDDTVDLNILSMIDAILDHHKLPNNRSVDWRKASNLPEMSSPYFPWCDKRYGISTKASVRSKLLGRLVQFASSQGFVMAIANLLAIFRMQPKPWRDHRAISNGALLTAIESNLCTEVKDLTHKQLHEAPISLDAPLWPVESEDCNTLLNPFIDLAIRSGNRAVVELLFDRRRNFFAQSRRVKFFESLPISLQMLQFGKLSTVNMDLRDRSDLHSNYSDKSIVVGSSEIDSDSTDYLRESSSSGELLLDSYEIVKNPGSSEPPHDEAASTSSVPSLSGGILLYDKWITPQEKLPAEDRERIAKERIEEEIQLNRLRKHCIQRAEYANLEKIAQHNYLERPYDHASTVDIKDITSAVRLVIKTMSSITSKNIPGFVDLHVGVLTDSESSARYRTNRSASLDSSETGSGLRTPDSVIAEPPEVLDGDVVDEVRRLLTLKLG